MKVSGKQKELADLLASFPAVKHLERCLRLHLCLLPHIPDHTVNHWEKTLQPITNCPQHFLWPWLGGGEGVWKDCHIFWRQFSPSHPGKAVISFCFFSLSVQHIQFKATIATHSLSIHTNVPRCPFNTRTSRKWIKLSRYHHWSTSYIYLTFQDLLFLLGFYVSQIVKRWLVSLQIVVFMLYAKNLQSVFYLVISSIIWCVVSYMMLGWFVKANKHGPKSSIWIYYCRWEQFSALPSPDQLTAYCHALVDLSSEAGIQWARRFMRWGDLQRKTNFWGMHCLPMCFACGGSARQFESSFLMQNPWCWQVWAVCQFLPQSDPGLATRRELQLLEGEADLGRVWHVPISWSMIMIRRFAVINTTWTFDQPPGRRKPVLKLLRRRSW